MAGTNDDAACVPGCSSPRHVPWPEGQGNGDVGEGDADGDAGGPAPIDGPDPLSETARRRATTTKAAAATAPAGVSSAVDRRPASSPIRRFWRVAAMRSRAASVSRSGARGGASSTRNRDRRASRSRRSFTRAASRSSARGRPIRASLGAPRSRSAGATWRSRAGSRCSPRPRQGTGRGSGGGRRSSDGRWTATGRHAGARHGPRGRPSRRRRRLELEDPDLGLEPSSAAELLGDRVEQEPAEPRLELGGVAEPGQIAPAPDERFLDGVFGDVGVLRDEPGDRVEPVDHVEHQHVERVAIAVPCLFDQIESHADLGCSERCRHTLRRAEVAGRFNLPAPSRWSPRRRAPAAFGRRAAIAG